MIKAGLFQMMYGAPGDDVPALYHDVLEQVEEADRLGYDALWLVEHHFVRPGEFFSRLPAPLTFASAAAARTRSLRLGTAVKDLPIDNPLLVAEEAAVVDILSEGRLNLGVGTGLATDYPIFGAPTSEKAERFREMIDILLTAWEGKTFDYRGKYFAYEGVTLSPVPLQDPRTLIWIASRDEGTIRWAAQRGLSLLMGQIEAIEAHEQYVRWFHAERARAGVTSSANVYGTRLCYVAATNEQARREIEEPARRYYERFRQHPVYLDMLQRGYLHDDGNLSFDGILHNMGFIVGGPESVRAQWQAYIDRLGVDGVNCMTHISGLMQEQVLASMRLFATEVQPRLQPIPAPALSGLTP